METDAAYTRRLLAGPSRSEGIELHTYAKIYKHPHPYDSKFMLLFIVIVAIAVFAAAHSHPQRRIVKNHKQSKGIFNTEHELAGRSLWGVVSKGIKFKGVMPKPVRSKTMQSFSELHIDPVPLNKLSDFGVWVANVDIGTPPIPYRVAIETGSSVFWVYLGNQQPKTRKAILEPGALHNFTINQNDLTLKGTPYEDTIEIGTINKRGRFVSIVEPTNKLPYDGVLGLALAAGPYAPGGEGFFQDFISKYATRPIFALYLGVTDPQMHIGGADASYYDGEIEYHKVRIIEKNELTQYWEIGAGSLHVRGATIVTQGSIIDSGTRFIYGPPDQVKEIYHAIRGTTPKGPYEKLDITFPCHLVPRVAFSWSGKVWEIHPEQFNTGPKSKNSPKCEGVIRISTIPDPKRWILGTPFLTGVYTVFDGNQKEPQVGFGHLQGGR